MGDEQGKKSSKLITPYEVDFSTSFDLYYQQLVSMSPPLRLLDCIDDFIQHYETYGLSGWTGKISPSNRIPEGTPNREELVSRANRYNLYHAHVGDPYFRDTGRGYSVSDGVLHFQKLSSYSIKLISYGYHRPMELPTDDEIS